MRGRLRWKTCGMILTLLCVVLAVPLGALATSRTSLNPSLASPFQAYESSLHQSFTTTDLSDYDAFTSGLVSLVEYFRDHINTEDWHETEARVGPYNRRRHFGGWINENGPDDCLDTRNEVLLRDAAQPGEIRYKNDSHCMIVRGVWLDPYSGQEFKLASAMQIDHVVPLNNAYRSGAHQWAPARRCYFANYLGNAYHLRTVSGRENMTKGGRGPEDYIPPNEPFLCTYLSEWMKIKAAWQLTVTPQELSAIEELARSRGCRARTLSISVDELSRERQHIENPPEKCRVFESAVSSPSLVPAPPPASAPIAVPSPAPAPPADPGSPPPPEPPPELMPAA